MEERRKEGKNKKKGHFTHPVKDTSMPTVDLTGWRNIYPLGRPRCAMGASSQAGMHHAGLHGTMHTGKGLKRQKKPLSSLQLPCILVLGGAHTLLWPGG